MQNKNDDDTKRDLINVIKKLQKYKTESDLKEVASKLKQISMKKNVPKDKSSPKEFIKQKMKYKVKKARDEKKKESLSKLKEFISGRSKSQGTEEKAMKEKKNKK